MRKFGSMAFSPIEVRRDERILKGVSSMQKTSYITV